MSIRLVRQKNEEVLRKISKPVDELNDRMKILIEDMKDTMREKGGCGLAAVQVGILKSIIVCSPEEGKEYVYINPEILEESKETEKGTEGCLSVEGFRGDVIRPKKIKLKYQDEDMKEHIEEFSDFHARVICHEVDHTKGILYTDKVINGTLKEED